MRIASACAVAVQTICGGGAASEARPSAPSAVVPPRRRLHDQSVASELAHRLRCHRGDKRRRVAEDRPVRVGCRDPHHLSGRRVVQSRGEGGPGTLESPASDRPAGAAGGRAPSRTSGDECRRHVGLTHASRRWRQYQRRVNTMLAEYSPQLVRGIRTPRKKDRVGGNEYGAVGFWHSGLVVFATNRIANDGIRQNGGASRGLRANGSLRILHHLQVLKVCDDENPLSLIHI